MLDRQVAKLLMRDLLALSAPLNSATLLTGRIGDREERERFRTGIGTIMNEIYTNLMMPIIRQYPELGPDNGSQTTLPVAGPHEGRELTLMIAGTKPLSMFVEPIPREFEYFQEEAFDALVADGKLIKNVSVEALKDPKGKDHQIRRVLYALPGQEWRISAILLVQSLYDSLAPGWRTDLDWVIGLLLGYQREDIENFIQSRITKSPPT